MLAICLICNNTLPLNVGFSPQRAIPAPSNNPKGGMFTVDLIIVTLIKPEQICGRREGKTENATSVCIYAFSFVTE